jgi:hypothetical protein
VSFFWSRIGWCREPQALRFGDRARQLEAEIMFLGLWHGPIL